MRKELDDLLVERYPEIFRDRHGDKRTTAMCWGFPGDGWFGIIDALCASLLTPFRRAEQEVAIARKYLGTTPHWTEERLKEAERALEQARKEIPVAVQVKEKFGTLRFYVDHFMPTQAALIGMAERLSAVTCEECGAPGTPGGSGWIRTLCPACRKGAQR
jgi:hypothetical protein